MCRRWLAIPRRDHIHQAFSPASQVFEHFSLTTSPFLFANTESELASAGKLDASENVYGRVSMKQYIPAASEAIPVSFQSTAESISCEFHEELIQRRTMM